MLAFQSFKKVVMDARRAARTRRGGNIPTKLLASEALDKFFPQRMQPKDHPKKGDMNHAVWVALWWSRALAQLSAQAVCGKEPLTFQVLLPGFLSVNQIVI